MASDDFENGVWRTIGGRRIFIRDKESISSAMKRSGKFKSAKKKNETKSESKEFSRDELKEKYGTDNTDIINAGKEKEDRVALKEEADYDKKQKEADNYIKNIKEHLSESEQKEFEKAVKKDIYVNPEKASETINRLEQKSGEQKSNAENTRLYNEWLESKGVKEKITENDYKRMTDDIERINKSAEAREKRFEIDRQKRDLENEFGLKVKDAFETDKFGTGKADRFQLEDGRFIEHSTESLGSKDDTWTINSVENGKIQSKEFRSFEHLKDYLGRSKAVADAEDDYIRDMFKAKDFNEMKKIASNVGDEKTRNSIESRLLNLKDYHYDEPNRLDYAKGYLLEDYQKMKDGTFKNLGNNFAYKSNSNDAYKKAFQEYKKAHPNSKLTLQKFIDMSEGK